MRLLYIAVLGFVMLVCLTGCLKLRESIAGVSEPMVTATTSPSFHPVEVPKIALLVPPVRERDSTRNTAIEGAVREAFTARLIASGYEVVSESTITAAMGRSWVAASDVDYAQAARMSGAPVLVAEVTDHIVTDHGGGVLDYRFGIAARLVAADSAIWWSARHAGTHALDQRGDESAVAAPIARGVAKAFPTR